jgi:hypothetical protein
MNISNRKLMLFRCHIDPQIGPNPKLAFQLSDPLNQAIGLEAELTTIGIYAKWYDRRNKDQVHEHIIPFTNIQSIKLEPETAEVIELKRKPGRPVGT